MANRLFKTKCNDFNRPSSIPHVHTSKKTEPYSSLTTSCSVFKTRKEKLLLLKHCFFVEHIFAEVSEIVVLFFRAL